MTLFRRRVGERFTDVLEWIDYRREANFWPFFGIPPLLAVAWAYGGWIGLGIVVAFALGVALFVTAAVVFAFVGWITANALLDVAVPMLTVKGRSTYSGASRAATLR